MNLHMIVPNNAGWTPAEQRAMNDHLLEMYLNLAPTSENDYAIRVTILTSEERQEHRTNYNLKYEPFAYTEDLETSMAYSEHWFVVAGINNSQLLSSEPDWDLVHNPAADPKCDGCGKSLKGEPSSATLVGKCNACCEKELSKRRATI